MYIVNQAGPAQFGQVETFQGWFASDLSFQRIIPWILFGPYLAALALYFPLERGRLGLNLPLNLAVCAVFLAACHGIDTRTHLSLANVTILKGVSLPLGGPTNTPPDVPRVNVTNFLVRSFPDFKSPHPPPGLPEISSWSMLLDLLAYGAIAGLAHSVHFYRRFRERERRALLLESNLAQARLDALRAQLQPHFLFNSLNAIVALLRRDPPLAEKTLLSLSELLRLVLSQSQKPEISLREEMDFVDRYVQIQQMRFGDKLRFEQELEPAALLCLVPTLCLQPLIENAIRHGIEPAENAGLVRLTARRQNEKLNLTIENDGAGLSGHDPPTNGTGLGLANLRARFEALYGAAYTLELVPRAGGGVIVHLEMPCRPTAAAETDGASNSI